MLECQEVGEPDQPEGSSHSTLQRRKRREADDAGAALEPQDNRADRHTDYGGIDHAGQHASGKAWSGTLGADVGA